MTHWLKPMISNFRGWYFHLKLPKGYCYFWYELCLDSKFHDYHDFPQNDHFTD